MTPRGIYRAAVSGNVERRVIALARYIFCIGYVRPVYRIAIVRECYARRAIFPHSRNVSRSSKAADSRRPTTVTSRIDDTDGPPSCELVQGFLLVQQRRNPQFRGSLAERRSEQFSYPCTPRSIRLEKKWISLLFSHRWSAFARARHHRRDEPSGLEFRRPRRRLRLPRVNLCECNSEREWSEAKGIRAYRRAIGETRGWIITGMS